MSIQNIPQIFQNDDTIYHYTTSETALLHILKDMKLRLSPRLNSHDPIENAKEFISYSGETDYDIMEIGSVISSELKKAKQISFCKNKTYDLKQGIPMIYPFEKYGFAKPRMWDNYGNKYKGVCIALSRNKLEDAIRNTALFDNNDDDVEYLNYREFSTRHQSIIWKDTVTNTFDYYLRHFKNRLFYKHKDYEMENEYRICSLSNEPFDYIDIKDAIIGLVVSDIGINEHLYDEFAKLLSRRDNLHFLIISFNNKNLSVQSYQDRKSFFKLIERKFKKALSKQKNNENKDNP